jgi:hypothetical protein
MATGDRYRTAVDLNFYEPTRIKKGDAMVPVGYFVIPAGTACVEIDADADARRSLRRMNELHPERGRAIAVQLRGKVRYLHGNSLVLEDHWLPVSVVTADVPVMDEPKAVESVVSEPSDGSMVEHVEPDTGGQRRVVKVLRKKFGRAVGQG